MKKKSHTQNLIMQHILTEPWKSDLPTITELEATTYTTRKS